MNTCPACNTLIPVTESFCASCGANQLVEHQIAAFHQPALKKARTWILVVGILYAVSGLVLYGMLHDHLPGNTGAIMLGTNFALLAIHVGLWAWAKTQPYPAAIVALVLFVTVHLVEFVQDPSSIVRGILIKVIFIVALTRAISAGKEVQRLRAQSRPYA